MPISARCLREVAVVVVGADGGHAVAAQDVGDARGERRLAGGGIADDAEDDVVVFTRLRGICCPPPAPELPERADNQTSGPGARRCGRRSSRSGAGRTPGPRSTPSISSPLVMPVAQKKVSSRVTSSSTSYQRVVSSPARRTSRLLGPQLRVEPAMEHAAQRAHGAGREDTLRRAAGAHQRIDARAGDGGHDRRPRRRRPGRVRPARPPRGWPRSACCGAASPARRR